MKFLIPLSLLTVLFVTSCDKGINPTPTTPSPPAPVATGWMTGVIHYQHWPPVDSLHDLRIVAFRDFPPGNIISAYVAGRAAVYPPIGQPALMPFFVDSLSYAFALSTGEYRYVVVAQQFGPNQLADWRAVGQYDLDSNLTVPSSVTITENDTTLDVNFNVDFANPPPPPPLLQ